MPTLTIPTVSIASSRLANLASAWRSPAVSGEWSSLALISAAWGSSFLFVKLISASVPPFAFAAERGFIAMAALLIWIVVRQPSRAPDTRHDRRTGWGLLGPIIVLGTTNGWAANVLTAIAVKHVDSSLVAVVQATVPLLVVLLAHFLFADERFRAAQFAGIVTGFIGILFVVGPLAVFGGRGTLVGIGAMIVTALCYACGTLYGRRRVAACDTTLLACGQQGFGALVAATISLMTEPDSIGAQSVHVWLLLLIVGVLCSAVPTLLYLRMLTRTTSGVAALVAYLQPVWAALLGWAVLGERLSVGAVLGASLVLVGIAISTRSRLARRAT